MARHIKTRDYSMLQIIMGATKAGVHRDNRAHTNKYAARGKEKMIPARKRLPHDLQTEWTREGQHGETEVFDIYGARQPQGGWYITHADIIDEDGETVSFNVMSFSTEELLAIKNALEDEWLAQRSVQ